MNRGLAVMALGAALAGCAVGPAYMRPEVPMQAQWAAPVPVAAAGETDLSNWWRQFRDPELTALIERALAGNRDVRLAVARIGEARALQRSADARALPNAGAYASAARDRMSENNRIPLRGIPNPVEIYQAGFDASWELDLFGGVRRARDAAAAETGRVEFDREAVAVSVSAEVASSYMRLRGAQARLAALEEQIEVARETIKLVEARVRAGLVSELDLVRAREILAGLQARRPLRLADAETGIRRLGVLVGAQPDSLLAELAQRRMLPDAQPLVPATLPAELLARRADLRAIERGLAAENARVGIAEADRYPRLALSLSLGLLSLATGNFATQASAMWNAGARFTAPIYEGGAPEARLAAARARYEQAAIRYELSAVEAAEEVESASVRYARERERRDGLLAVVRETEDARNLSLVRYRGGLGDFLAVLDAQRQLFNAQDDEIVSLEQSLMHLVSLYKALGGGWEASRHDASVR